MPAWLEWQLAKSREFKKPQDDRQLPVGARLNAVSIYSLLQWERSSSMLMIQHGGGWELQPWTTVLCHASHLKMQKCQTDMTQAGLLGTDCTGLQDEFSPVIRCKWMQLIDRWELKVVKRQHLPLPYCERSAKNCSLPWTMEINARQAFLCSALSTICQLQELWYRITYDLSSLQRLHHGRSKSSHSRSPCCLVR